VHGATIAAHRARERPTLGGKIVRHSMGVLAVACLVSGLAPQTVVHAQPAERAYDFTASGGWSWPVYGDFADGWNSGFTLAGGFGRTVNPHLHSGFEIGYAWHGLDADYFKSLQPTLDVSGGDAGIFSIMTQTDVLFGSETRFHRPFINFGLGLYSISVSDVYVRGGSFASFEPKALDTTNFGLHIGGGFLVNWRRAGVRIEAAYHHIFTGGTDVGYVPVRLGFVFRPLP
jgi:hypothetical protein